MRIRGSLPELITKRRFGPLWVGQNLDADESELRYISHLDELRQPVYSDGYGFYDLNNLEIVAARDKAGLLRISGLFVRPQSTLADGSTTWVDFDFSRPRSTSAFGKCDPDT